MLVSESFADYAGLLADPINECQLLATFQWIKPETKQRTRIKLVASR
jgi:hypothetical protein